MFQAHHEQRVQGVVVPRRAAALRRGGGVLPVLMAPARGVAGTGVDGVSGTRRRPLTPGVGAAPRRTAPPRSVDEKP